MLRHFTFYSITEKNVGFQPLIDFTTHFVTGWLERSIVSKVGVSSIIWRSLSSIRFHYSKARFWGRITQNTCNFVTGTVERNNKWYLRR